MDITKEFLEEQVQGMDRIIAANSGAIEFAQHLIEHLNKEDDADNIAETPVNGQAKKKNTEKING